ncbi:MAG: DNA polymerase/3'-5' exonuclease PolX [Pseudobdellovibrio sp.]
MPAQNTEVAKQFNQIADLLEIKGENRFRIRAYRNAARTISDLSENVADLIHNKKDLTELPGIGKDLALKIIEIVDTGHLELLEKIEKEVPVILRELLKIPLIGPKRVQLIIKNFKIKSLDDFKKIVLDKSILQLHGFGEKIRLSILEELNKKKVPQRILISEADETVELILKYLQKTKGVKHLSVAGSIRRRKDTIGDIDILLTTTKTKEASEHFLKYDKIIKVLSQGATRTSVLLKSGVQVDLRVVQDNFYGAALLYFTGSKNHNVALRTLAMKQGLKINEYGIFKGSENLASENEKDIYKLLKMPYIEPELREDNGEIEAALQNKLPKLIEMKHIQGDLHIHTNATDGSNSIKDIVTAAKEKGYAYIAITDHSEKLTITNGLNAHRLLKQIDEIDQMNKVDTNFTILKSIEVDILADGQLDMPEEILKKLDLTVCAIHSNFNLSKIKQTDRILRAMENPYFTIFAHPTSRLINERDPIEFDFTKIILQAKKLNRILEINAQPTRMDLTDFHCRLAKESHVKFAISTDSHSLSQFNYMQLGVDQARRGWLEKNDIINTYSILNLKKILSLK